jgi:DNA primase
VALLPSGHDPDTFLQAHGAAAFTERIDGARSLLGYALDRVIGEAGAASASGRGRASAFARVALMLAKVSDGHEAAALSREAAVKLGVDPTQLWTESRRLQATLGQPVTPARPAITAPATSMIDRDLVPLLLHVQEARRRLLPLVEPEEFGGKALQAIVAALKRRADAAAETLLGDLDDEEARARLAALLVLEPDFPDLDATIRQFERLLDRMQRVRRMREVGRSIAELQEKQGALGVPEALQRALLADGTVVHGIVGGAARPLDYGPPGP